MLSHLLVLASLAIVAHAQAQTVRSVDSARTYTCPDRSTIEAAYHDYCKIPSFTGIVHTSVMGSAVNEIVELTSFSIGPALASTSFGGDLRGVVASISYPRAPENYTTDQSEFALGCVYQTEVSVVTLTVHHRAVAVRADVSKGTFTCNYFAGGGVSSHRPGPGKSMLIYLVAALEP